MRTRDQYFNLLKVYVAGKASEIEFCGLPNQTLGVGGDFQQIRFWLNMMARAGMLGPLGGAMGVRLTLGGALFDMPPEMSLAMEETFQQVLNDTRRALRDHDDVVRALVALLVEREELLADDVKAFFEQYGFATPEMALVEEREAAGALPEGGEAVVTPSKAT
jgi:ATP-dependent Zn protease